MTAKRLSIRLNDVQDEKLDELREHYSALYHHFEITDSQVVRIAIDVLYEQMKEGKDNGKL